MKGGLRFAVRDLATNAHQMSGDDSLLGAFLCTDASRVGAEATTGALAVDQASEARLVNVLLAHSATAIESTWTKEAWRVVDSRKAAWLGFLATHGYRLAEVEQLVVDEAQQQSERRRGVVAVAPDALDGADGDSGSVDAEDAEADDDAEEEVPDLDEE